MGVIKVLPDTLISQIAAGEVVERPASVAKELIENSLDAGAKMCWIEIEQGGMKLISVRDDGCGMNRDDVKMAFSRHATSKIYELKDLENIKSFGFRGEALSAIASVAFVKIRSRHRQGGAGKRSEIGGNDAQEGYEVIYKGGVKESESVCGCAPGTEVVVRNLFYNTPARRKFLKTEQTEIAHIVAVVSHMAIANPFVGFELKCNGKILISVPSDIEKNRANAILGKNFLEDALPVNFKTLSIDIHGFIGKPGMSMSSKRHQYLFVNGRDVTDPLVGRAVIDAYGTRLPPRNYPMFILHINIDPKEVDVNVHPRKLAVKFLETQKVYRDILQAVEQALDEGGGMRVEGAEKEGEMEVGQGIRQQAIEFSKDFISQEKRQEDLEMQTVSANIIGQIANSYILIFDEEGLKIIDQHAAHERIMYEKFKRAMSENAPAKQPLLIPFNIECSREEAVFLKQAILYLSAMGFEFDEWSGNTFVMRACPVNLKKENLQKIFRDFLDDVMSERQKEKILPERILKSLACKSAVKFGMKLSAQEQEELLAELKITPNNQTCPHGRPTRIILTFNELEQRFYRRS